MIYTKSNSIIPFFKKNSQQQLKNDTQVDNNDIFLYDRHDLSLRKIMFKDFIFDCHWEDLRNNSTLKILIFFSDEYFNILDIKMIAETIKEKNINESQIYFLAMDENFKNFAEKEFCKLGITNIKIDFYNRLLMMVKKRNVVETPIKKFSSLSRNYSVWRLKLYIRLLEKNLLDNFVYTFNNINPYDDVKIVKIKNVKKDLKLLNIEPNKLIHNWINRLPYSKGVVTDKFNDLTYKCIEQANFNILIESHFDPFRNFEKERSMWNVEDFSPGFPTEKTYKTIISKRPFIAFSTPFFLKDLRQMGYKTFRPYINEDYDLEVNNEKRLEMIVSEIERINNLNKDQFELLVSTLKFVTDYNYNHLMKHQENVNFIEEFNWIKIYFE